MSLASDIVQNLTGFSKAMYSTWFFYRPARMLMDSGEGVSTSLDNFSFGIEQVFLSHGHYDHLGGLPGLVHARNSARGDKEKDLTVLYPAGDSLIRSLRDYVGRVSSRLTYKLEWREIEPEERIPLRVGGQGATIRPFRTRHTRSSTTLGYAIVEKRSRLAEAFAGLAQEEIRKLVIANGRDHVMEDYEKILLAYGGDSTALSPEELEGAEVLVHDATFLSADDRDEPTHATSEEALRVGRDANVKCLILHHVSSRYAQEKVARTVLSQAEAIAPGLEVLLAMGRGIQSPERLLSARRSRHG